MEAAKWLVWLAILGFMPCPGAAQQADPAAEPRSSVPAAPLPLAGQREQVRAPSEEPARARRTLAEFEAMAERFNPTLAQASARVQAARGQYLQAGLYPNPVAGYVGDEMGDNGTAGKQGGLVGQEFVTGGKLRLNREVACREVARLEQVLAAQRLRVLTDVRTSFYDVLIAQRRVELADRLARIANQGVKTAETLLKAKEASRVDLLQARVEANTARILLETAQNRHRGAWRRLAAVAGNPDMTLGQLAGDAEDVGPVLRWGDALAQVMTDSPELAATAAEVQAARSAARRARVEWVPNVNVEATVEHDNATGDDLTGVQVTFPLPVFNRNQGNIITADARLMAAQRNVERVRLSLQNRLAAVYQRYASAAQEVESYRKTILPDAKESLDLVTTGYRQGEFSYLNLLTAQRTYFQTNLSYLDALRELRTSAAEIEGRLLSGSLGNAPAADDGSPVKGSGAQ